MALLEELKKSTERITGWQRPAPEQASALLRRCKRGMFRFGDDGKIPNHPRWPVIIYWSAVHLPRTLDPAAVMEELFESNGWSDSWRRSRGTLASGRGVGAREERVRGCGTSRTCPGGFRETFGKREERERRFRLV